MNSLRKTQAGELPVSLGEAKLHLRVTWDDDDELIAAMMLMVAEEIEAVCMIPLGVCTFEQTLDEFPGYGPVTIGRRPVTAFTSLEYYDADGVQRTLDTADYFAALQTARLLPNEPWPATQAGRPEAITLTFEAGVTADNLPPQARSAFMLTLANRWALRGEETTNTSMGAESLAMPPAATMLLRQLWNGVI